MNSDTRQKALNDILLSLQVLTVTGNLMLSGELIEKAAKEYTREAIDSLIIEITNVNESSPNDIKRIKGIVDMTRPASGWESENN